MYNTDFKSKVIPRTHTTRRGPLVRLACPRRIHSRRPEDRPARALEHTHTHTLSSANTDRYVMYALRLHSTCVRRTCVYNSHLQNVKLVLLVVCRRAALAPEVCGERAYPFALCYSSIRQQRCSARSMLQTHARSARLRRCDYAVKCLQEPAQSYNMCTHQITDAYIYIVHACASANVCMWNRNVRFVRCTRATSARCERARAAHTHTYGAAWRRM